MFNKYLSDSSLRVLDIGAGGDFVTNFAIAWDVDQGNAERIDEIIGEKSWDIVFASHCLEHMADPDDALRRWFSLVKPNGIFICIVPDEQLYEQGFFPSIFNSDHKATFSINEPPSKRKHHQHFVSELIHNLETKGYRIKIEYLSRQDANYNYNLLRSSLIARILFKISRRLFYKLRVFLLKLNLMPKDQTLQANTCAQICFILQRL